MKDFIENGNVIEQIFCIKIKETTTGLSAFNTTDSYLNLYLLNLFGNPK